MELLKKLAPGYKTNILVALAIALAWACPTVLAHYQVDCAWVDKMLGLIGFGSIATLRVKIPTPSSGKAIGSAIAGILTLLGGPSALTALGFDPATQQAAMNILLTTFVGTGVYGLGSALDRA